MLSFSGFIFQTKDSKKQKKRRFKIPALLYENTAVILSDFKHYSQINTMCLHF
jgi:hypothetical protein